jgi:hypothetical protein
MTGCSSKRWPAAGTAWEAQRKTCRKHENDQVAPEASDRNWTGGNTRIQQLARPATSDAQRQRLMDPTGDLDPKIKV